MKKYIAALGIVCGLTLGISAPVFADSPGTQGPPSQSCQDFSATTRPGNSA